MDELDPEKINPTLTFARHVKIIKCKVDNILICMKASNLKTVQENKTRKKEPVKEQLS